MRRQLIRTSLDSYPLEFLSVSASYRVVHGDDVLAELPFDAADIRLQCERELKSKILLLREAYVDSAGSRHVLRDIVSRSLPAMTAIFQGLLFLRGRAWKLWGDELLEAGHEGFSLDAGLFRTRASSGRSGRSSAARSARGEKRSTRSWDATSVKSSGWPIGRIGAASSRCKEVRTLWEEEPSSAW
jgi:hypothetical protein